MFLTESSTLGIAHVIQLSVATALFVCAVIA